MKKFNLDPLSLDKETIALLDEKQLQSIVGGLSDGSTEDTSGCAGGTSECSGRTTGCTGGTSKCGVGGGEESL